jgi:hypothetical protein
MRSEETLSFYERNKSLFDNIQEFGGIVFTLLAILSVVFSGCIGNDPYQNLTAEDAAFMRTADELPFGVWAANVPSELTKDYQKMYDIAKAQKEIDENRIRVLSPMPVSEGFQDIKEELLLSDEFGAKASEYEMNWTLAMMASDQGRADRWWDLEEVAMDESINHSARADRLLYERYGYGNILTPVLLYWQGG